MVGGGVSGGIQRIDKMGSFSLSGGFTPCPHLRPSSGRQHTVV